MFAVVSGKEMSYQSAGFFRKGFTAKVLPYRGGEYVDVVLRSKKVNWKKLHSFLGEVGDRAVFCGRLELPESCGLKPVETGEISYVFLKNAVEYWLKHSPVPIQERTVTIIDLRGVYHDLARVLARYCALLKVVTLHRESYNHLAWQLREEFGAVLQIDDVINRPNNNLMIVSPKGFGADFAGAVSVPVVTLEPEQFHGAVTLSGFAGADLSHFELDLPPGVDHLQLAAALYGVESHREIKNFLPERCFLDNCETTLQNILEERFSLDTGAQIAYNK